MSRLIHFEIHAAKPQRAMKFYSQLFTWKFAQSGEEAYWLAYGGDTGGNLFSMMPMATSAA